MASMLKAYKVGSELGNIEKILKILTGELCNIYPRI